MPASVAILYQDPHLVIVDKPPGLYSTPSGDAPGEDLPAVLHDRGLRVFPVHRLDRDVSGAVLFALDEQSLAGLEALFRARGLTKIYWALAQGRVRPADGLWHFPLLEEGPNVRVSALGKKSETRYRTLAVHRDATELEIELITGRRNQIRVHAAHAGHALVGERKYARGRDAHMRFRSRRVALHAWRLEFAHPVSGDPLAIEAPLPADLLELRERAARA